MSPPATNVNKANNEGQTIDSEQTLPSSSDVPEIRTDDSADPMNLPSDDIGIVNDLAPVLRRSERIKRPVDRYGY